MRLEDLDCEDKTVLLQMSLDVPLHNGNVADTSRLSASEPTIRYLLSKGCKIIICGHVGRPKGRDPELSTKPVSEALTEVLQYDVQHIGGVVSEDVRMVIDAIEAPAVLMLENTRYDPREQECDMSFAKELASYADCFVSDDYPTAHRAYAINTLIPTLLPSAMGRSMQKEYDTICHVRDNPEAPVALIIGGAKADKIGVIDHMMGSVDKIIVGGVLANTFLKASGVDIQGSKFDEQSLEIAGEYLRDAEEKFMLPLDVIAAEAFEEDAEAKACEFGHIPKGWMILDVGPKTLRLYTEELAKMKTIIWGGPIGVFEWEKFSSGTRTVTRSVADSRGYTLVAGGDSGDAVREMGYAKDISHLSIGGGATLALIAGEELPAVQVLQNH